MTGRAYTQAQFGVVQGTIVYGDSGNDIELGDIPQGANVISARVNVTEAFNAGTTDYLRLGISAGGISLLFDVDVSAVGAIDIPNAFGLNPLAALRTIYGRYTGSGTAPTTGSATIILIWELGMNKVSFIGGG